MTMLELSYVLYRYASSSSHHHFRSVILHFSTAAATTPNPTPEAPPYIVQYLIDTCGLSPSKATRASKHISSTESSSKPYSVIRFLKQSGLDDAHIRGAISRHPSLLLADVETTLKPKFQALRESGFNEEELPQLIDVCPFALTCSDLKHKIEFWRAFYPTNEGLFKAIRRDQQLLRAGMERILPNISFLRRCCNLSDGQIGRMILRSPRLVTGKLDWIQSLVQRAKALGVLPGSGMFYYALCTVKALSDTKIKSKIRLLESFGCSEEEIQSVSQKSTYVLMASEKKIQDNMNFLTKKAGCDSSYVIFRPTLLLYSLERRLIPRHRVLQILKLNGLAVGSSDLLNAMILTDKKFLDKFILPYKDSIPKLHEAYVAAFSGKIADHSNC